MQRLLILILITVSACAAPRVTVPNDVALVPAQQAHLDATAAVNYHFLSDQVVGKRIAVTRMHGEEVSRRETAIYQIAPASRKIITKALMKVFPNLTIIDGNVNSGTYDIIIVPRLVDFDLHNQRTMFKTTEANIGYDLGFHDGRNGKNLGIMSFYGYSKAGVGEHKELTGDQRAIVRAMEDAVKNIPAEVSQSKFLAPWRDR